MEKFPPLRDKIVAHLKDGEIVKGHSRDFDPGMDSFHLFSLDTPVARSRRIEVDHMKALFFVHTWGRPPGEASRRYHFGVGGMKEPGRRAIARFQDGEQIPGYLLDEPIPQAGFYMVPADPSDNNIKIFVVRSSLDELRVLEESDSVGH